jgi:hypothetical protein
MPRELKVGDRVRVTARYGGKDYQPGDQGTVSQGPSASPGAALVY